MVNEFKFEVSKEFHAAFLETMTNQKHLEEECRKCDESSEKYMERYSRDVSTKLIPELKRNIYNLESAVQEKKFINEGIELETAIKELEELNE